MKCLQCFHSTVNLVIFRPQYIDSGYLVSLLIQFYTDLFETLHMFSSWSEDVHVFGIKSFP